MSQSSKIVWISYKGVPLFPVSKDAECDVATLIDGKRGGMEKECSGNYEPLAISH